jgi:hypothetical protein
MRSSPKAPTVLRTVPELKCAFVYGGREHYKITHLPALHTLKDNSKPAKKDEIFEAFVAVMFQVEVFCFVVGYQRFRRPDLEISKIVPDAIEQQNDLTAQISRTIENLPIATGIAPPSPKLLKRIFRRKWK